MFHHPEIFIPLSTRLSSVLVTPPPPRCASHTPFIPEQSVGDVRVAIEDNGDGGDGEPGLHVGTEGGLDQGAFQVAAL